MPLQKLSTFKEPDTSAIHSPSVEVFAFLIVRRKVMQQSFFPVTSAVFLDGSQEQLRDFVDGWSVSYVTSSVAIWSYMVMNALKRLLRRVRENETAVRRWARG